MRAWLLIGSLAWAAGAAAQTFPSQEPKSTAPTGSITEPSSSIRQPTPSRHQFSSPVMPIQIEGAGLAVPAGAERDNPYSAPATVPVPAKPPSPTAK